MGVFHNLTTDKAEKHDVVRFTLTIFAIMLPFIMVWGVVMSTLAFFLSKNFDMQGSFMGILAFTTGVGTLLSGGGFAMKLKKEETPDGVTIESEKVSATINK